MSQYVDRFIRQHKEYFSRNKVVIENNKWNLSKNYEIKIKELSAELSALRERDDENSDKRAIGVEKEIKKLQDSIYKNRASLFKQENELTNSILGRLSAFIKEVEGERHLPRVQKFIDETVCIIDIHVKKCDEYLDYNMDVLSENEEDTEETIDYKNQEIAFQDGVFNKKIEIQDKLDSLNINNSVDNLTISFFKGQKATIPMISVLPHYNVDIALATKNLNLSEEITDKEFFIHKDPKTVPQWNPKKHYWEQDKETIDFWWNEWLKINYGFEVDGYFFHPWLYYHLNFFKTFIPVNKKDTLMVPPFRDNEWYIAELLKESERRGNVGILLYGSRRISKSTDMASICEWKALIMSGISTAITSGSDSDLSELTHKIKTSMKYKEYAFQLPTQKQEWSGGTVELGLKWDASTLIEHSRHTIKNLDSGAKKATQKTAGGAPSVFLLEEIGKFAWKGAYTAAQPSFETEDGWKTTVILVGTGGEASLSVEAVEALANPSKFKLMEMDWDLLESKIPPEAITWKRRKFANFVPAQMGLKTGFKRIERGFGDFLGIDSPELNKIKIFQTDWENNTKILLQDRKLVEKDNFLSQQEAVQYPIDPEECFLSAEQNPFPYLEAKQHKEYIIEKGDTGKKVMLIRNSETGKITAEFADEKIVASYPHTGGFIDSPVLLFMDLPENPIPRLFVSGYDDYKQDESNNSPSVGTLYIKMVDVPGHKMRNRIVASLSTRPDPHGKMHRQWHLLLEAFGCKAFGESEDEDFRKYLTLQRLDYMYLVESMDFASDMQDGKPTAGKRKYGWTPTPKNKAFLFGLLVQLCRLPVDIIDENGNEVTILWIQTVNDVAFLDEVINYKKDNNVDRLTALMGALGYEFYLYVNYMFPKLDKKKKAEEEVKNKKKPVQNLAQRMFKTSGKGSFFR